MNIYGEISRAFGVVKRGQSEIQNLWNLVTGTSTTVSAATGLQISTVYSCVDTISKTFASLPSAIMLEEADGDHIKYKRHPLWRVLTKSPYDNMTMYDAKRMILVDYLVWGNGYQIKVRDSKYRLVGLKNIRPWDMWPFRDTNHQLWYQCYDQEFMGTYPASEVIHLRDIGYHPNPDMGMSKIDLHATTIGKEKAAAKFINTFYSNGMFLGGVIEYPKEAVLGDPEIERLRTTFKQYYGGIDKGAQVAIITGGGTLKQFKSEMPLSNAQYVESAKLNTQEICRIYSVPPPKIGYTEGTPYNSLESLNVDYWQNCILPIVTMYEQEIALKCFTDDNVYLNHNFDSVLRADVQSMAEYYSKMFRIGVYTINDIKAKLEENKIEGGDRNYIEGNNMVPIDLIDQLILKQGKNDTGK